MTWGRRRCSPMRGSAWEWWAWGSGRLSRSTPPLPGGACCVFAPDGRAKASHTWLHPTGGINVANEPSAQVRGLDQFQLALQRAWLAQEWSHDSDPGVEGRSRGGRVPYLRK